MQISHINENIEETQSVQQHCMSTAQMAEEFSVDSLKKINYAIALLHDIGKYQNSFQQKNLV